MAWTKSTKNGYGLYVTTAAIAMVDATAAYSDIIYEDIGQNKILVGVQITVAGANVAPDLRVQFSHDETTWVDAATATASIDNDSATTQMWATDLSTIAAPYYRISYNADLTNAKGATSGAFKFIVCALIPGSAEYRSR